MADYRQNVVSNVLPLCTDRHSAVLISCHQLFGLKKHGALQEVIGRINSGLNSSKKRLESVAVLSQMVEQCSASVFSSNCQTWLNLLLQCLQSHATPPLQQRTLHVLSLMIERVSDFPELAREVGSTYIAQLLPVLLALKSQNVEVAVTACINTCILHFPGPSGAFKGKIEAFVTGQLDNSSCSVVSVRCYALLARCGTGGTQGIKHREGWSQQCGKLLSTLHAVLTQLYEGLESGQEMGEDVVFSASPVSDSQPEKSSTLVGRFQVLCSCLETLMREPFPTWIQMPAEDIFDFVCRVLAVQLSMLISYATVDKLLLMSYLPFLHHAALKVLIRLILCCKKLLLPEGSAILQLCLQCLAATQTQVSEPGQEKPFSKVREAVYAVLSVWLQVTGSACQGLIDDDQDDILQEIFLDIQPQSESLKIESKGISSSEINPPPAKRKKKGRGGYQEMSQSGTSQWSRQRHANSNLAVSALRVLQLLVTHGGGALSSQTFQTIQQKVGGLILSTTKRQLPPYASYVCRQALYQTLLSTVSFPRPDVPSFLQAALVLFQQGTMDSDFQVASTCQEAILRLNSLVHITTPNVRTPAISNKLVVTETAQSSSSCVSNSAFLSDDASVTLSTAADNSQHALSNMVSTSSATTQNRHVQQTEKPTSTSSLESVPHVQPSTSKLDTTSSTKRLVSQVSSSFSGSEETFPKKRKHLEDGDSSDGDNDTAFISEPAGRESDESSDDDDDDSVDDSNMAAASSYAVASTSNSAAEPGSASNLQVRSSGEERNTSVDMDTATSSSGRGKGQSKRKVLEHDPDDGAISSSSSEQATQEQSDDVQAMLMSFVDAGPDSD